MKRSIGVMGSSGVVVIVGGRTGTLGELAHSRKPSCFYDAKAVAT